MSFKPSAAGLPESPDHTRAACDNCDWAGTVSQVAEIKQPDQRLEPGSEIPVGECPKCGALAYLVADVRYHVWLHLERQDGDDYCDVATPDCLGTFADEAAARQFIISLLQRYNPSMVETSDHFEKQDTDTQ